jgi:D-methionine transport system ATP-binding protein
MIEIQHISKTFSLRDSAFEALHDVSLTIQTGEIFGLIGESGAGKSTLVRCINLLERPTEGHVVVDGKDVTNLRGRELRAYRSSVGMIFQNLSLFQQRSVLDNVRFPATLNNNAVSRKSAAEQRERALHLLGVVDLADKADSYPNQLSGGQQQRVAIARALMTSPSILLCDEATSALDTLTTATVLETLRRIRDDMGITIVLITHSLNVAHSICDRIAVMDAGRIVEEGTTAEVFESPKADITRALLGIESGKEVA